MNFIDFIIDIDKPFREFDLAEQKAFSKTILQRILLNRIKNNKPTVLLLVGDSGEGKSYTALDIIDFFLEAQGIDFSRHLDDVIIYSPLEYAKKIDRILFDKELKKINVIMLDEARQIVKANTWHSFVNQTIADINAMSRGVKPVVYIVVTQFIKDIDPASRRTLTFYAKCARPRRKVKMRLYKIWKDDRDLDKPKLKKRRIYGVVRRGRRKQVIKPTFNFSLPRKEIVSHYEEMQRETKAKLIRRKLEIMVKKLEAEFKGAYDKVDSMVSWYVERPEALNAILERKRKKIKLRQDVKSMHDLTNQEVKEFEKRLKEKLKNRGLADGLEEKNAN